MVRVPTGIKAWMPPDEFLGVYIRSSLAFRHQLMLVNNVGIIDSDYFENPENDGHIMVGLINLGRETVILEKGERFAQAIFQPFRRIEEKVLPTRQGGLGSTGTGVEEARRDTDVALTELQPDDNPTDRQGWFLGYPIQTREARGRRRTSAGRWEGNQMVIELASHLSPQERRRHVESLALRLLASRRLPALRQRIWRLAQERFAGQQLPVGEIHFRQQNRRWGSCSSRGNISLSYRLLTAPDELLDYVCIHELAHLVEFNHSPRFWELVARADPDYRLHREALKEWGQRWQEQWQRRWQPAPA